MAGWNVVRGQALGLLLRRLLPRREIFFPSGEKQQHRAGPSCPLKVCTFVVVAAWNMTDLVQTCGHRGDATDDDDDHRFRGDATGRRHRRRRRRPCVCQFALDQPQRTRNEPDHSGGRRSRLWGRPQKVLGALAPCVALASILDYCCKKKNISRRVDTGDRDSAISSSSSPPSPLSRPPHHPSSAPSSSSS